ncbi:MAG TPA: response regulator [bacterium]|nr:response regulator [bacterium]
MKNNKPILLVEDDSVDAMTVRRALKDIHVLNRLDVVKNGEEAIEYLENGKESPCVILLDINMPRMNGIEFLKAARAQSLVERIPVVVLTTSKDDQDIIDSFKLCVAGYILKPVTYTEFIETVRTINLYWTLSELPH